MLSIPNSTEKIDEASYILGSQQAFYFILSQCLSLLPAGYSPDGKTWGKERYETVLRLRALCIQLDIDTSWPDDLYLTDIIKKLENYILQ